MELVHLIYASTAKEPFSEDELLKLLYTARIKNEKHHVSGMLLSSKNNFFQVLEGNKADIESLFETIKKDQRHQDIVKIIYEPILKRAFGEWTMGFVTLKQEQLKNIPGLNDFFTAGTSLTCLDMGRAKKLLKAFSSGDWQNNIK